MTPEWRAPLLLLGAALLAYANAFNGAFQFDDYNVIVNNPLVHSYAAWWQDLQQGIRPLLKLSYTLDWTSGTAAFAFHLSNILLHLLNTLLVWQLSRQVLARHAALAAQAALPLYAALLFALHPANSEAVTYICGRSSSLMALFYLLGLWLYSRGRERDSALTLHGWVPLCMLLALASKESAITFPAALLLWEWVHGGSFKTALRAQWSSWLLLLLGTLFFFWHAGYYHLIHTSLQLNPLQGNAATQLLAFIYLLRQWFAPLWLNIDPDLPLLQDFGGLWPHALLFIFYIYLIILNISNRRWLSFALLWALLHLLPLYLLLPRLDVANERQLYLAAWPLALAVVVLLAQWLRPAYFKPLTLGLLLVLAALTVQRNHEYRSEIALWEATVKLSPDKARVHNNLGYAYKLAGRVEEAKAEFASALRLDPHYSQAYFNLQEMRYGD